MTNSLTPAGYAQTKLKLARLEERLREIAARTDLAPAHQEDVRKSYEKMIAQYRQELKLYEARAGGQCVDAVPGGA